VTGRLRPLAISLGFVCLQAARLAFSFERLPPRMATHFDRAGKPNGYQTRADFAWSSVLVSLALFALFAALPPLMARAPVRLISLPNKEYWLAPERRADTLVRLSVLLDWLGCATIALLVGLFELIVRANLARAPLGFQLWILLPTYHLFVLFWTVAYLRGLRRPDSV
jgi:uncharacterized membrane protein